MSRSHFTALAAALALGAFAPRLMAQDTSSTAPTRPDTSGYTGGAGGIDTSASPGRIGATDTTVGGAVDTVTPQPGAVTDSMAPGGGDSSGVQGLHASDSTKPGSMTSPGTESNGSADSGGSAKPSN